MRKAVLIIWCTILIPFLSQAQQRPYEWRIGVSGGYSNYYGDLSPHRVRGLSNWDAIHHLFYYNENYVDRPSFNISLERQLSPSIGLMLNYGQYTFAMSDRYLQRNGTLMLNAPNFDRALNFRNHTRDMGLSLVFKLDNDRILPADAFIAPYFTLGGGILDFQVDGDLLDGAGNPYDYAAGNVVNNRVYETRLTPLNTEREAGYSTTSFYANLGLGIRFRLGPRLELFAQSDFIYAFTDFLDDVSGTYRETYDNEFQAYAAQPGTNVVTAENPYRGNPNSQNDWILYHSVGLKFNFGKNKKDFTASRLSPQYPDYSYTSTRTRRTEQVPDADEEEVEEEEEPISSRYGNTYNYFGTVNFGSGQKIDSLDQQTQMMLWEQEIQSRRDKILTGKLEQNRLRQIQAKFDDQYEQLRRDTILNAQSKDSLLDQSRENRFELRYGIDSIQRREQEMMAEIDSLRRLKGEMAYPTEYEEWEQSPYDTTAVDTFPQGQFAPQQPGQKDTLIRNQLTPQQRVQEDTLKPTAARRQTGLPTEQRAEPITLEEKLQRLEEENQRLRAEQEQLRTTLPPQYYAPQTRRTYEERMAPRDRIATRRAETRQEQPQQQAPPPSPIISGGAVSVVPTPAPRQQEQAPQPVAPVPLAPRDTVVIDTVVTREQQPPIVEGDEGLALTDTTLTTPEIRLINSKADIYFSVNEESPSKEEMEKVIPMIEFLRDRPDYKLSLIGYADNTGNINYNLRLIQSRLAAVVELLQTNYGLAADQIDMEVGGQVVRGSSRSGHSQDRKVEVRIVRRQ